MAGRQSSVAAVSGRDEEAGRDAFGPRAVRPSAAQRRYLERGVNQAGGKLPLFDLDGREIPRATIEACIANGWAERWFDNPMKRDWLVCRLTEAGYRAVGAEPPKS